MLFVFGSRTNAEDHGETIAASCPRCHNRVVLHHLSVVSWFTLFFIPVIPMSRKRVLVCPTCQWSCGVPRQALAITGDMQSLTSSWRAGQLSDAEYAQRVDAYWAVGTAQKSS